jgi:uncharacterized protein
VKRAATVIVKAPLLLYQRGISPALPRRCKYEPTCSRYALQAIERYGVLRGMVLAGWRLLRCNPWSHGGYDPVQAQRLFEPCSHVAPRESRAEPSAPLANE